MTQIKIGDRVVTRKFEETTGLRLERPMKLFIDKEGVVEQITPNKHLCLVHGFYWPPSAVELVSKEWEPEYGKEYEFSCSGLQWTKATFIAINPKQKERKYVAIGQDLILDSWNKVRPINLTLEEKIIDYFVSRGFCFEYAKIQDDILEILNTQRPEVSEKEIRDFYYDNHNVVATVRHFLSLANETNGKK